MITLNVDVDSMEALVKELEGVLAWTRDPDYDTKELMDGTYQVGKTNIVTDVE